MPQKDIRKVERFARLAVHTTATTPSHKPRKHQMYTARWRWHGGCVYKQYLLTVSFSPSMVQVHSTMKFLLFPFLYICMIMTPRAQLIYTNTFPSTSYRYRLCVCFFFLCCRCRCREKELKINAPPPAYLVQYMA